MSKRNQLNGMLFIVIPVLNGWTHTKRCLDALSASTYSLFKIIIVDHGSTDDTKLRLKADYPEVIHLLADPDLWWAGASNVGIRYALDQGAEQIMLLNNDCFVTPETLRHLIDHSRHMGKAVIAPIQRSAVDKSLLRNRATSCFLLGFPTLAIPGRLADKLDQHSLVPVRLIMGGRGVIVPTSVFNTVGLLDEVNLPHYGADHDFYLNCKKHRIPLFLATDAHVYIDDTRTTLAARLGALSSRKFLRTLTDRRSHKNLRDLSMLFKKHYPIKGLHYLGVALNLLRYLMIYLWKRAVYLGRAPFNNSSSAQG